MATRMSYFGNALGDGMTGTVSPQDLMRPGRPFIPRTVVDTGHFSFHPEQAGPTVISSPSTYDNPAALSLEDFHNIPDFDVNPELEQYTALPYTLLGAQTLQQLSPTPPSRAPSVKRRGESPLGRIDINHGRKRKKRRTQGFQCLGCERLFDLECEAKKHFKSAHTAGNKTCPEPGCGKSFHWEKDVRRHLRQVHHKTIQKVDLVETGAPSRMSVEVNSDDAQHIKKEPGDGPKRRHRSLSTVVTMMKALTLLTGKQPEEQDEAEHKEDLFWITQGSNVWHSVSVTDVHSSDHLRERIIAVCSQPPDNFILHRYRSQGRGKRIPMKDLLSAAIAEQGKLKVVITSVARAP